MPRQPEADLALGCWEARDLGFNGLLMSSQPKGLWDLVPKVISKVTVVITTYNSN